MIQAKLVHFGLTSNTYTQLNWISGYTYSVDVFLFTDAAININRPTVTIDMGDATILTCTLSSLITNQGICIKKYSANHSYFGQGIYNLTFQDSFRVAGIKNILNSQTQKIQLSTYFTISSFSGPNSNPTLQNFPVYFGVNLIDAIFDPNFIDSDGDSLSYSLLQPCYTNSVTDYYIPNGATLTNNGIVSFSKDSLGLYAFSYQIKEWRKDPSNNYYVISWSHIDFSMDINSSITINELNSSKQIALYPNPVSNTLFISSHQNNLEDSEIEITNTLGQIVLKGNYKEEINVSELHNGCYVLKIINSNNQQFHSKFIKQ